MDLLSGTFVFSATIQVGYWLLFLLKICLDKYNDLGSYDDDTLPGVSVIVCIKDELHNLRQNHAVLLDQNYEGPVEFIFVDDDSRDGSDGFLEAMKKTDERIKVIRLTEGEKLLPGKKGALEKGIQSASNELILLTDADCRPIGDRWIRQMIEPFRHGYSVVLGYSPFEVRQGILNLLIRFETTVTAMLYVTGTRMGKPYMAVGRNLAYAKDFFDRTVFLKRTQLLSGDDDLLINRRAEDTATFVNLHQDSFVIASPVTSWPAYLRQKKRHLSTARTYNPWSAIYLSAYYSSLLLTLFLLLLLLFLKPVFAVAGLTLVYAIKTVIGFFTFRKLSMMNLLPFLFLAETIYACFLVRMIPSVFGKPPKNWN